MSIYLNKWENRRLRAFHSLWRRQVFLRKPHDKLLINLFDNPRSGGLNFSSGLYFIASGNEILYIGQTNDFSRRLIESLGRVYHQIPDISLPWSVAFAKADGNANELESAAIYKYAPVFNTSIPRKTDCNAEQPSIVGISPVFADQQQKITTAFTQSVLEKQSSKALLNPNPPWVMGKSKRKSSEQVRAEEIAKNKLDGIFVEKQFVWNDEIKNEAISEIGVSLKLPLKFKINLIDDGSVITEDGEFIGMWEPDEDGFVYFMPDGQNEIRLCNPFVGLLCKKIEDWYESQKEN